MVIIMTRSISIAKENDFTKLMKRGEWCAIKIDLLKGVEYKFSASGNSQFSTISLAVQYVYQEDIKRETGSSPTICFKPDRSITYLIIICLTTTAGNNNSDTVIFNLQKGCGR